MKNLHLYFPEDLYNELKGGDWPDYSKFLNGDRGPNTEIKTEINGYIDMYVKDGILFPNGHGVRCISINLALQVAIVLNLIRLSQKTLMIYTTHHEKFVNEK